MSKLITISLTGVAILTEVKVIGLKRITIKDGGLTAQL